MSVPACIGPALYELANCGYDPSIFGLDVSGTPGAEDTNAIDVAVQVSDIYGKPITQPIHLYGWLSDVSTGIGIAASAPSGGFAVGAAGIILEEPTANKTFQAVTNAAGLLNIVVTESTDKTFYLVVVRPNGTLSITEVDFD